MTIYTTEYREVVGVGVTIRTSIPLPSVIATVYGKVLTVMVKVCRLPVDLVVTVRTASGKSGSRMVGVRSSIVIPIVTPKTRRRGIGITIAMTTQTLVLYRFVRSLQYIKLIVVK
jgi:hypothetical protein